MPRKQPPQIRVLVVDDQRTFAEALAMAVGLEKGFVAEVATSGQEALEKAAGFCPDVVVLDMQMPGMNGVQVIRRLREAQAGAMVVAISGQDEDLMKARAIEAGAVGYILKDTPLMEIPRFIRRVHNGETLIEEREMQRLLRVLRHRRHQESTERQRANRLSPRQLEILQLMADGLSSAQIADKLGVTPFTLRTHVQNILMRLGVHTKLEALAVAIRHHKISAEA